MQKSVVLCLLLSAACQTAEAPASKSADVPKKTIAAFTRGMQSLPGFVDLFVDAEQDHIHLRLSSFGEPLLYATAQASGLGSNPIGLDRGSLGPQEVIEFRRAGPKVLVLAQNLRFRATSANERERAAVADSFAPSVIASLPVKAEDDGSVVVDATGFFLRDATDAARRLGGSDGSYRVDQDRSALWLERTRSFPDNTEVEVLLTFTSSKPRGLVAQAANADAVTLRQHHSFVRLPDDGYRPRRFDPRVGYFGPQFMDYAAPLGESMHRHFIARHRLQKKDPRAAVSDPVEPIVYYIDPATPEPVRSALREGASWWAEAFLLAGFSNAFRVELLPPDADPMDVRYHMIHWVHRQTRGWSYGASISDPRTGEIIKGNVLLGSLRVRHDHLKFVGLLSPFAGQAACAVDASPGGDYLLPGDDEEAQRVALMRIRQLAAHEVGHTLGLSHNFAASTYGRASVMDYPAPLVKVADGDRLDFGEAYDVGIGEYDTWAITFGYAQFAQGADEERELDRIVQGGLAKGYVFLTDQDARSPGTGHPLASLWDNGVDPIEQLGLEIEVRAIGLRRFGIGALRPGTSLASLEDTLVPLYLHHRYQLEAVMKLIGGVDFRHAVKGDGQVANQAVPAERQRRALELVLRTLMPEFLQLDPRVLQLVPPAPPGHPDTAERFPRNTGQVIDPMAMALVCAGITLDGLLHEQRAARLADRGDGGELTFDSLLQALEQAVFGAQFDTGGDQTDVQWAIQNLLVDRLMDLTASRSASASVRTAAESMLSRVADRAERHSGQVQWGSVERARAVGLSSRVRAFLNNPAREPKRASQLDTPDGAPIGGG